MPAVNIQGQNSLIEQPMPSSVSDAEFETPNKTRALATAPFAPALKHVKEFSAHYWGARQANTNALAEARQTKVDAQAHRDRTIAEYTKTGHKLTPEATAEDDAVIREAEEEIAKRSKKKFPTLDYDEVRGKAARLRNWPLHTSKYFVGDTRHPTDLRKGAKDFRIAKEAKLDIAIQAPRHSENALESGMACLRARAEKGRPNTGPLIQGFVVDYKGEFQLNTDPQIVFPEGWSKPTELSEDLAMVDNALDIAIWANFDAYAAAITKQILAEADDANAIRDADRPALIAAAKAELEAAQRAEEFANVACEKAGVQVFRPYDWPIHVLLQVEAPPKTKPVPRAPVVNAAHVEEADMEFEDAGDE
jgi:hypothetical protein